MWRRKKESRLTSSQVINLIVEIVTEKAKHAKPGDVFSVDILEVRPVLNNEYVDLQAKDVSTYVCQQVRNKLEVARINVINLSGSTFDFRKRP